MGQSLYDGAQSWLRCAAGKGIHRRIHCIHTGFGRRQNGGPRNARGVMGMEMNGKANFLLQSANQSLGRRGLQQSRHIFESQHMRTGSFQLLGHRNIVFQIIFCAIGIQNITGVTDRAFADPIRFDHSVHSDAHIFHPIEAVKHAEDVHTRLCCLSYKELHHIVRIVGIAHPVAGAQKHLGHDIGHARAQIAQSLPRAFLQKAIGHIKGRSAPAFNRK